MPQLAQLSLVYSSQWFWLLITLAAIYVLVGHGIVPKVEQTVDDRGHRISADLAAADDARREADAVEAAYRERMDASRTDAANLTAAAKDTGAKATEASLAKSGEAIDAKLDEAMARIAVSRTSAAAEIEQVAAELVSEIVIKVAGFDPGRDAALSAVREVAHG